MSTDINVERHLMAQTLSNGDFFKSSNFSPVRDPYEPKPQNESIMKMGL